MEQGEGLVTMVLPVESGRYVEGALNGVNFRIPTGVPVEVPMRIYRVLEQSRRESDTSKNMLQGFTAAGGWKLP